MYGTRTAGSDKSALCTEACTEELITSGNKYSTVITIKKTQQHNACIKTCSCMKT